MRERENMKFWMVSEVERNRWSWVKGKNRMKTL